MFQHSHSWEGRPMVFILGFSNLMRRRAGLCSILGRRLATPQFQVTSSSLLLPVSICPQGYIAEVVEIPSVDIACPVRHCRWRHRRERTDQAVVDSPQLLPVAFGSETETKKEKKRKRSSHALVSLGWSHLGEGGYGPLDFALCSLDLHCSCPVSRDPSTACTTAMILFLRAG